MSYVTEIVWQKAIKKRSFSLAVLRRCDARRINIHLSLSVGTLLPGAVLAPLRCAGFDVISTSVAHTDALA
jgi:hypothetical protein